MHTIQNHPVTPQLSAKTHITEQQYKTMYKESIEQPEKFWAEQATNFLSWEKTWESVCEYDFSKGDASWFTGGKTEP